MARMVNCVKLGRELPGLEKPPFPGDLGQRIYDNVSAEGYALWPPHMTILINHYGLSPADPEARRVLREQMEEFFFGEGAQMPEGWSAPGAGGKGGAKGGGGGGGGCGACGAAAGKGGGAARK
ncbi:MAG: oxidative damage protection protein [Chloroflexi bacterium]|nr:oxidative damage protection protein [Chloroflexota bacterium]